MKRINVLWLIIRPEIFLKVVDTSTELQGNCGKLPALLDGKIICHKYTEKVKCYATCSVNYVFPNGNKEMYIECEKGKWTPPELVPECVPKANHCQRPLMPVPGEMQCLQKSNYSQCTARCLSNHKFPDGTLALTATCLFSDSVWIPFTEFPSCIEPSFEETWGCHHLQATANGQVLCVDKAKELWCFGRCHEGFSLPTNLRRSRVRCDKKRQRWLPPERTLTCNTGTPLKEAKCCLPHVIPYGRVSCLSNSSYGLLCNGTCISGYQFSDGRTTHTLYCDERRGQLLPLEDFPVCIPLRT